MAIYKGREVTVHIEDISAVPPQRVGIIYNEDGRTETVQLSEISFTKEEKAKVQKVQSDRAQSLKDISPEDQKKLDDKAKVEKKIK